MNSRADAALADTADPLAGFRNLFEIPDTDLLYLDGNSLGRPPKAALARMRQAAEEEWAGGLVRSWSHWIDLPGRAGAALAPMLGAAPNEVILADQTSVNLYKLAAAALADRPGCPVIVTDDANFPSDSYVLEGVAAAGGGELRVVPSGVDGTAVADIAAALTPDVGLVSLSLVAYKTAALADLAAITATAHRNGALVLWDLSHAAGIVPIDLGGTGADLAVGCTYKYLNGGPGAPAFLYVRADLQERLEQPIRGWLGHAAPFAFEPGFRPAPGMARFVVGTPPIISLIAAAAGIEMVAEAGIEAIRAKSIALTDLIVDRFDAELVSLGFSLGSSRNAVLRGGHVSVRHPDGFRISTVMRSTGVIADFRAPDSIRLAPSPLYTGFAETWDAVARIATIVREGAHRDVPAASGGVT